MEFKKTVLLAFALIVVSAVLGLLFINLVTKPGNVHITIYIRADGNVDPSTANITSADKVTYTFIGDIHDPIIVQRDNIVFDGAEYTIQGTGNGKGIDLTGRSKVTIKNMKIQAFENGIYLSQSLKSNISGNNIKNNYNGIWLQSSSNNRIAENNITNNNKFGIWLYSSSNNSISGNNIKNNENGILPGYSSNYNNISGNNITTNKCGIYPYESSNNFIYHNNFVNNTNHVYIYYSANVWDDGYPYGGNHWSNYTDVDHLNGSNQNETGSDGIWDHIYVIDENNKDNYPLVTEFSI